MISNANNVFDMKCAKINFHQDRFNFYHPRKDDAILPPLLASCLDGMAKPTKQIRPNQPSLWTYYISSFCFCYRITFHQSHEILVFIIFSININPADKFRIPKKRNYIGECFAFVDRHLEERNWECFFVWFEVVWHWKLL